YHFTFTGQEPKEATVVIRDGTVQVKDGHEGEADLRVTADSETWLGFLAKERSLLWALRRRRIRIKGSPKLLVAVVTAVVDDESRSKEADDGGRQDGSGHQLHLLPRRPDGGMGAVSHGAA